MLDLYGSDKAKLNTGSNFAIDGGTPTGLFIDYIQSFSEYIDGVKFGWGTGLITPQLEEKIECLQNNNVPFWFGGTAFEIAYIQNKLDTFTAWAKEKGAKRFEVSDGSITLDLASRKSIITELSNEFEIFTEVGSKDANVIMSPSIWVKMISEDLESGAKKVILEGRESGAAGIYRKDGEVRTGLIDDVEIAGISYSDLIFEAPVKDQQVWFIKRFGIECNLANLPFDSILNVETLRKGLRSDVLEES